MPTIYEYDVFGEIERLSNPYFTNILIYTHILTTYARSEIRFQRFSEYVYFHAKDAQQITQGKPNTMKRK